LDAWSEDPILRHAEARKGRLLAPEIVPASARRNDLDDDVGSDANRLVELYVMTPRGREERDIGLQDVVLVEDDIDRGYQGDPAPRFGVPSQSIVKFGQRQLMARSGRRAHIHLAVVQLVTAPVIPPRF